MDAVRTGIASSTQRLIVTLLAVMAAALLAGGFSGYLIHGGGLGASTPAPVRAAQSQTLSAPTIGSDILGDVGRRSQGASAPTSESYGDVGRRS